MTVRRWGDESSWGDDYTWGGLPIRVPPLDLEAPAAHEWAIFVRDGSYRRVAQLDDYMNPTFISRHHAVGSWTLDCSPFNEDGSRSEAAALLLKPGAGIIVTRDRRTVFSGPVRYRKRSRDAQGVQRISVTGMDDMLWLALRVTKPEPSNPEPPYSTNAYDTETGLASTLMRHYVGANLGSGATAERRLSALTLDPDPLLGGTASFSARYHQLLAVVATLGRAANLGFRILQDEDTNSLRFMVTATVDRRGQVVFSETLGNIAEWSHEHTAADANYLYALGSGTGTTRTVKEYAQSSSILEWGRAEQAFDQRSAQNDTAIDTAAHAQLAQTADKTTISFTVVPTGGHTWPDDYDLGDLCTAIVDDQRLDDIIRELRIDLTDSGEQITPTIATTGGAHATVSWQAALAWERRRIAMLEGA